MNGIPDGQPDPRLRNVPIVPGSDTSHARRRASGGIWIHVFPLVIAAGVSLAVVTEVTTRAFFIFDQTRHDGDPCLTFIRATTGPDTKTVWANFGGCPNTSRDPDREMIAVDLRYGLFLHYKTESIMKALPFPFTRVLRNRDGASRSFGTGGTHTYDIGLVGDAAGLTWVDLVLAGGGRVKYRPMPQQPGWFNGGANGYFGATTLQWTGGDWRLRRDDGTELLFPESEGATRLEQAALLELRTDSEDVLLAIDRDRLGNIRHLSAAGEQVDFDHDERNRITAISSAGGGQLLQFAYNSAGCLVRQTGSGDEFRYEYQSGSRPCQLWRSIHNGVPQFAAEYDANDRVVRVTDPVGGTYDLSYETDSKGNVVSAAVREPDGTTRRIALEEGGFWFTRGASIEGDRRLVDSCLVLLIA